MATATDARALTISKLHLPVMLGDFNLEGHALADVRAESSDTLTATSSNANQQHVASGLANHTHNL